MLQVPPPALQAATHNVPGTVYGSWLLVRYWLNLVEEREIPYTIPDQADSTAYIVTEVAEVIDAWLRLKRPRDTRAEDKSIDMAGELCDVFIMTAHALAQWPNGKPYLYGSNQGSVGQYKLTDYTAPLALLARDAANAFNYVASGNHTMSGIALALTLMSCTDVFRLVPVAEPYRFNNHLMYEAITNRLIYRTRKVVERAGGDPSSAERIARDLPLFIPDLQQQEIPGR